MKTAPEGFVKPVGVFNTEVQLYTHRLVALVAQLVVCHTGKPEVMGSIPSYPFKF